MSVRTVTLSGVLAASLALQAPAWAQEPAQPPPPPSQEGAGSTPTYKPEELEQLVAPIALYPDALLAQLLMASTYPLEVVQAARWSEQNKAITGDAIEPAVEKQPWDPSVRSLASFPQVLKMMNDKLDWTQKLGDAFLAQENDLMAAVQTLRAKAKAEGNLKSTAEQTVNVETDPTTSSEVIAIEPASPQTVYVPTYDPTVVYGAWPYPAYPPYYWYPAGWVAAGAAITFGVGLVAGAALWGGMRWGYRGGAVTINRINHYNRINHTNITSNRWQHNAAHRRGVQYRDTATSQRFNRTGPAGSSTRQSYRGYSGTQAGSTARTNAAARTSTAARTNTAARSSTASSSTRSSAFQTSGSSSATRMSSSRGSSSFSGGRMGGGMRGGGGRR
jgi:hypothetical protein